MTYTVGVFIGSLSKDSINRKPAHIGKVGGANRPAVP
jgi:hypothetical protein